MQHSRAVLFAFAFTALSFQACNLSDANPSPDPEEARKSDPDTLSGAAKASLDSASRAGKSSPLPASGSPQSDSNATGILNPSQKDSTARLRDSSVSPDTLKPAPGDSVKPGPIDSVKPAPADSGKPAPIDSVKPVPADSARPAPVDTAKPLPVDTVKPRPSDTLKPAPPLDTLKPLPVDTSKPAPIPTPVDTLKPALPPLAKLFVQSDLEDQTASCWTPRNAQGYSQAPCGTWSHIGTMGAQLAQGKAHSGSKALSVTFSKNEEVAGASLPVSADFVNVRAYYMFDAGFDFGQGVKVGRISSFNEATQLNDIDIILAVRSSGSVNQCGLTDMADLSLLFNGKPVGYDWGSISGAVRFERGRWYAVEYQVKLNRPGASDGWVKLWVDGRMVASKEGINIRGKGGENVKLNRLRMGGWYSNGANGNSCQNPSQPSTLFIDDVAVGADYIGP